MPTSEIDPRARAGRRPDAGLAASTPAREPPPREPPMREPPPRDPPMRDPPTHEPPLHDPPPTDAPPIQPPAGADAQGEAARERVRDALLRTEMPIVPDETGAVGDAVTARGPQRLRWIALAVLVVAMGALFALYDLV